MITKIFKFCKTNDKDIVFAATVMLVAVISFGLGRLSKIRDGRTPLTVEKPGVIAGDAVVDLNQQRDLIDESNNQNSSIITAPNTQKSFVASKNGKKYYYAWCDSASRIKKENKVWFSTKEEAKTAGYEPAANCKGL